MKVAFALVAAIALTGCGSTTVDPAPSSARDIRPRLVLRGPTLSPDPTPAVTSCSRLLAEGWEPSPFNDFDVSTSPTLDIAEFTIGNDRLYLDIRNDVACQRLPTLGPVITRLLDESEQPVASNAEALAKGLTLFAGWGLREAEPPHGSPSAVLWSRERDLVVSVIPPDAPAPEGKVVDEHETAGVTVQTVEQSSGQVLVSFTHEGFVIHVQVLVGEEREPDLVQANALVDGLLCPIEGC